MAGWNCRSQILDRSEKSPSLLIASLQRYPKHGSLQVRRFGRLKISAYTYVHANVAFAMEDSDVMREKLAEEPGTITSVDSRQRSSSSRLVVRIWP